jgi:glucosamine--fructose-6-phosphate aminotransferase (isomerizing)
MCGIFGYLGTRDAPAFVLEGLARLEYRGYDSAGIAVVTDDGDLAVRRAPGKLQNLIEDIAAHPLKGHRALGHTRWATHGAPTEANAHPHADCTGRIVVVHNGIVENYVALKERLLSQAHTFTSNTDSEVICHLIEEHVTAGHPFVEAVRLAASELKGAHGIASIYADEPDTMVALRIGNAGGVSVGYGQGEMYLSSDLSTLLPLTTRVVSLPPGEMAIIRPDGSTVFAVNPVAAAKGGYRHFMLKEIMEQPEAAMSTLRGRITFNPQGITLDEVPFSTEEIQGLNRVTLLGMGTSNLAAQVGARLIESLARIPATAENSSEFRYRDPVADAKTLVVSVAQSGETADTLEAMHEGMRSGARTLTICNVDGSQATRLAEGTILMHAGLEVGVAASKTFTNSMLCLYLLALHLGRERGVLDAAKIREHVQGLELLPGLMAKALELNEDAYERLAAKYAQSKRFLFIGRGLLEPIAKEGALKLKEISYIHAEGLPAAELKHGPIALVDPETPVVALTPQGALYDKMMGNISEVKARNGQVIALATEGDVEIAKHVDDVLWMPNTPPFLVPMVAALPLQLLAYHTAVYCGCDVDQPRNLAKSVTVE